MALRDQAQPSVILLRRLSRKPAIQLEILLANLAALEQFVLQGSIIVLEEKRIRVRRLPVGGAE